MLCAAFFNALATRRQMISSIAYDLSGPAVRSEHHKINQSAIRLYIKYNTISNNSTAYITRSTRTYGLYC